MQSNSQEYEQFVVAVQELKDKLCSLCTLTEDVKPDWDSLDYTKNAVKSLYTEYRRMGGHVEFLEAQYRSFLKVRQVLGHRAQIASAALDRSVNEMLRTNLNAWVSKGYAREERRMLAELNFVEDKKAVDDLRFMLEEIDFLLEYVKAKIRQAVDFKTDAKALKDVLAFGHFLNEL